MNSALNVSQVLLLTNATGTSVAWGDVVAIHTVGRSFTDISGADQKNSMIGVVFDVNGIANGSQGLVVFAGYAPRINLTASGTPKYFVRTAATPRRATAYAVVAAGAFGQLLNAGTAPDAMLFGGVPQQSIATQQTIFTTEGALTVAAGALRIYNNTGGTLTFSKVLLAANTAPVGAAIIVDVNKGGTTIFTTQSNRPQIADGANTGNTTTFNVTTWADGEYLTVDIDQIGSGTAGSNLTVHIITQ